ncbi:MAG: deoxyribose-phosphate aldolase [Bacteroidia bacterium]|nr:deoxyribose-phosphate aldolase [Bacteroidia bacterium]
MTAAELISAFEQAGSAGEKTSLILSLIDLTSLEGKDTAEDIHRLCEKALRHKVAAVCVYPTMVQTARQILSGSGIRVASVAGGFPGGQLPLRLKENEVRYALDEGADEIDMVINRGKFLEHNYNANSDEIASLKSLCGKRTLKVILETGELGSETNISRASALAIKAGADFIKTSTGKIPAGASPAAVAGMLLEIKRALAETGKRTGIKPAGGIPDAKTACGYIAMTRAVLGNEWISPERFRIGASRLVDQLAGEEIKNMPGNAY